MVGRSATKQNISTTKALSFPFVQDKVNSKSKEVKKYKVVKR